jgi:predicted 2-oxoglutarate/Fe(II)-dependent dioxygenase YbiX
VQREDRGISEYPRIIRRIALHRVSVTRDSHIAHADNERIEHGRWVPNHTPQRDYTGLAYLNDDFTGGELVFPDLDVVIVPKAGLLVVFPSDHEFVHAVPKVLSGKRYSLPVWFTVNPAKAILV